jgi:hypothetical protein
MATFATLKNLPSRQFVTGECSATSFLEDLTNLPFLTDVHKTVVSVDTQIFNEIILKLNVLLN